MEYEDGLEGGSVSHRLQDRLDPELVAASPFLLIGEHHLLHLFHVAEHLPGVQQRNEFFYRQEYLFQEFVGTLRLVLESDCQLVFRVGQPASGHCREDRVHAEIVAKPTVQLGVEDRREDRKGQQLDVDALQLTGENHGGETALTGHSGYSDVHDAGGGIDAVITPLLVAAGCR